MRQWSCYAANVCSLLLTNDPSPLEIKNKDQTSSHMSGTNRSENAFACTDFVVQTSMVEAELCAVQHSFLYRSAQARARTPEAVKPPASLTWIFTLASKPRLKLSA